jgi:pyrroloquinoline quinone (PQQ) biosynthesis protein C
LDRPFQLPIHHFPDLPTTGQQQHHIKSPFDKKMTENKLSSKLIRKWQFPYQLDD